MTASEALGKQFRRKPFAITTVWPAYPGLTQNVSQDDAGDADEGDYGDADAGTDGGDY